MRLAILERDGYRCTINLPGCKGTATEVDHIIPVSHGGARLDEQNLRAACKSCNVARGNHGSRRGFNRPSVLSIDPGPSRPW